MEKSLHLSCLLLSILLFGCAENEKSLQTGIVETDNEKSFQTGIVEKESDTSIILRSKSSIGVPHVPHDPELDGIYEEKGSFNDKKFYKHQSKNYFIFWDTGKNYGQTESEQHTGGHNQWDLSDKLGGDEIIYSSSELLIGDWSADPVEEALEENRSRTGSISKGPDTNIFLQSTGKIDIPHDPELDGIYEEKGNFNDRKFYKHQNKSYFIFWDTGKNYGQTESEQHTGGHHQWDLSDKLGGDEIIYSSSDQLIGVWSIYSAKGPTTAVTLLPTGTADVPHIPGLDGTSGEKGNFAESFSDEIAGDEKVISSSDQSLEERSTDTVEKGHDDKDLTGIFIKGPKNSIILKSTGKTGASHDPKLNGVYERKGWFNSKRYYKHQSKNYFIFWDTGKSYGHTESNKHTGGNNQWDLSNKLGGDEIISSTSDQLLGDWSTRVE